MENDHPIPIYETEQFRELASSYIVYHNNEYIGEWSDDFDIQPLEGYDDFYFHCDGYEFTTLDEQCNISVRELAYKIREKESWDGFTPIRLISCSSGKYDDGAAQLLADELGVEVRAPICKLFIWNREVYLLNDATIEEARTWSYTTAQEHKDDGYTYWRSFYPHTSEYFFR